MAIAKYSFEKNFRIQRSHLRCEYMKIEKDRIYSSKILNSDDLMKKLNDNKDIIVCATPFMNSICNLIKEIPFFSVLTDKEGCILNILGDTNILQEAFKLKIIPGAYMDESSIGTNAISMALSEKEPVKVCGEENYTTAYAKWAGAAVPIKDGNGDIIAILSLTSYRERVNPYSLGILMIAVNSIEKIIESKRSLEETNMFNKHIDKVFNTIPGGILTVNLSGAIIITNRRLEKMTGLKKSNLINMKIWDIIDCWQQILDDLYSKGSFAQGEIYIKSGKRKVYFNVSVYPIYNSDGVIKETIFIFNELNKDIDELDDKPLNLEFIEKEHIIKVLKKYKGSISLTAKVLGIGRNTLYRKMEKYNIDCSMIKKEVK